MNCNLIFNFINYFIMYIINLIFIKNQIHNVINSSIENVNHLFNYSVFILSIPFYLFKSNQILINEKVLNRISLIHNFNLVLFSFWTFISLLILLYHKGIVFQSNYYFQSKEFDTIIYLFYISKYYELFDIVLVYLKGKRDLFFQKYHHIGAILFWYLCYAYKVDGIWIATFLNSFIHTIMYSYYIGHILKIKYITNFKKYITLLQLCQLIPQPLCLYLYNSEPHYNILIFFTIYCNGLVLLFISFYYNTYINKIKI